MGRPCREKTKILPKYFTFDPVIQKQICKLCGRRLGKINYNLFRHMEKMHKSVYFADIAPNMRNAEVTAAAVARKVTERRQRKPVKLFFSEEELLESCVSLVATNGYPPSLMDAPGFQYIIKSILSGMNSTTEINGANIQIKINDVASQIRENIRDEVEGKMVSMKIDTAIGNCLTLLVFHIQYIVQSKITMRTLGFMKIDSEVSAAAIRDFMLDVLNEFEIDVDQIYSISYDSDQKGAEAKTTKYSADPSNNIKTEVIIKEEVPDGEDIRLETALHMLTAKSPNMNIVRTFENILQTAAYNVIETLDLQDLINKCREVAESVIQNKDVDLFDVSNLISALNSSQFHWKTTYEIMSELKSFNVIESDNTEIVSFIENFRKSFKPVYKAQLLFQQNNLVLGDCFKAWLTLKLEVKRLPGVIASQLYSELMAQEEQFNENKIITAGVYLDARFKLMLSADQNWQAQMHLKNLYDRIENIQQRNSMESSSVANTSQMSPPESSTLIDIKPFDIAAANENSMEDEDDEQDISLNDFFLNIEKEKRQDKNEVTDLQSNRATAHRQIMEFEQTRLDPDTNIIEYWESRKTDLSFLTTLAKVVQAVPVTHSSVQRCAVILEMLAENGLYDYDNENFQNVLMVKLNHDFNFA